MNIYTERQTWGTYVERISKGREERGDIQRISISTEDYSTKPEPVFVDLLRSPEIDSQPGRLVRQPFLAYRPARLHRLVKSIPRIRFLGSINVYKYGLRTLPTTEREEGPRELEER